MVRLALILVLGLLPVGVFAQAPAVTRCGLRACIELGYRNHPVLGSAAAQEAEAQALLRQRQAERLPNFTFEGSTGYLDGEPTFPASALRGIEQQAVSGWYWEVGPQIELPLFSEGTFIGQTSIAQRQAKLGVSEKEWKTRSLRFHVATKVAEAYVDLLKSRRGVQVNQEVVKLSESGVRLARVQFEQNLLSRADLLKAEVQLATARRDLATAEVGLDRAGGSLALAMGLGETEARVEVEDLPDDPIVLPALDALRTLVRDNHHDVKVQEFKTRASQEEAARIARAAYPTLSMKLFFGYADDFTLSGPSQFRGSLNLSVPVFDFGRIKEKAAVVQARAQNEEQVLKELKLTVQQDVTSTYYQVAELAAKVEATKKQIEQAAEVVKLNRALVAQDLLPVATLEESQARLLRLELEQAGLETDRRLAEFRLKLVAGE